MARLTPAAPATASRAMSCQGAGLKRSGLRKLRTRAARFSPGRARCRAGTQHADLEATLLPGGPIEGIAGVQDLLSLNQRGCKVGIELLEGAVIDQEDDRLGVAQRVLERQEGCR